MLEKFVLTILELNWNQHLGLKRTKLNICHHMLRSSTQLQKRSLHVVERTRTSTKCQKMKNARAKRAKILFFIVKYANLWGFCCRRLRGCLSSLIESFRFEYEDEDEDQDEPLCFYHNEIFELFRLQLRRDDEADCNNIVTPSLARIWACAQ